MTVNRSGKWGRRAGTLRKTGRNGRVRRNACSRATTLAILDRPNKPKISHEEWVIRLVTQIVGTKRGAGHVMADDIASDVIMLLLDAGGFAWDAEDIEVFCKKAAAKLSSKAFFRQEIPECEFTNVDGQPFEITKLMGSYPAPQEIICDSRTAVRRLRAIPDQQRQALEILCDGGNPIDVAEEMNLTPWAAIAIIKEAREYIDRVDPLDD